MVALRLYVPPVPNVAPPPSTVCQGMAYWAWAAVAGREVTRAAMAVRTLIDSSLTTLQQRNPPRYARCNGANGAEIPSAPRTPARRPLTSSTREVSDGRPGGDRHGRGEGHRAGRRL